MGSEVREVTARAIILVESALLVMRYPPKNLLFVPGGRVEAGEDLYGALARELAEELPDHSFVLGKELGTIVHSWADGSNVRVSTHHYFEVLCSDLSPTVVPRMVEPPLEFRWLGFDVLLESGLTPRGLPECLVRYLTEKNYGWNLEVRDL